MITASDDHYTFIIILDIHIVVFSPATPRPQLFVAASLLTGLFMVCLWS